MKILFLSSEVAPFSRTGGLADVSNSLPSSLAQLGHEVRIVTPLHGTIIERQIKLINNKESLLVDLGDKKYSVDIFQSSIDKKVPVLFFDQPDFFSKRQTVYGYLDDGFRFYLFCQAVVEYVLKYWCPDLIHCNDWHTGMVPNLLRTKHKQDKKLSQIPVVLTIHNLSFQGPFKVFSIPESQRDLGCGIPPVDKKDIARMNFLRRGIIYSDVITTVSESYSKEVLTTEYGEGLDLVLAEKRTKFFGIMNGIDYDVFNPAKDKNIYKTYDFGHYERKIENKLQLQREFGLTKDPLIPVLGIVSRITYQKGFDLLINILKAVMDLGVQIVQVGGADNQEFFNFFRKAPNEYPNQIATHLMFDDVLARKIYAGSDIFLMPSMFEPCGISQLIALRYGSIPVVHHVGGLADTVLNYEPQNKRGWGFVFFDFTSTQFFVAIIRALENFKHKDSWKALVKQAMQLDFSWQHSAKEYEKVYRKALNWRRLGLRNNLS